MITASTMNPTEAAQLLHRTDDDVDYQLAWAILRTMTKQENFRRAVLYEYSKPSVDDPLLLSQSKR